MINIGYMVYRKMMEHHPLKCSVPRLQRQLNSGSFQLQNAATERENNTSFPKQFQTHSLFLLIANTVFFLSLSTSAFIFMFSRSICESINPITLFCSYIVMIVMLFRRHVISYFEDGKW